MKEEYPKSIWYELYILMLDLSALVMCILASIAAYVYQEEHSSYPYPYS